MNSDPRQELSQIAHSLRSALEENRFWGIEETAKPSPVAEKKTESRAAAKTTSFFDAPSTAPNQKMSREEKQRALDAVAKEVAQCKKCRLHETRTNTVPGEGNPDARVMFVGEGPGANEDEQGRPFVGRAGVLLTDIIEKGMGIPRSETYIANIVKCRPPENRVPAPDEIAACMPYLRRQMDIVDAEITVPLGRPATTTLLETQEAMGKMRGIVHQKDGRKMIPTFHPAYLLRNPPEKKKTWEDIQLVMKELGLPIPKRSP